jgi:cell division protein FtsI/penicillin-binding protein 2
VARRRFGPLVVAVLLATAVLIGRLAQVQIGQHTVWADEAAALVRVGRVVPYRRGEIRDASGGVLVSDRATWNVVFVARAFRREHPLGQVAHALGALEGRSVPLARAWAELEATAQALVLLSPDALRAFARGEALQCGPLRAEACADAEREDRRGRASDLTFYVTGLLGLERGEARELARRVRAEREELGALPYIELAARVRRERRATDAEGIARELAARLSRSRADLESLAGRLAEDGADPLPALLARLEAWRDQVEDGAAGELFEEAAGFPAGRVEPSTLQACVDLGWLAALMRWDEARIARWLGVERAAWLEGLGLAGERSAALALDSLLVEAELAPIGVERAAIVLAAWTRPFLAEGPRERRPWPMSWLDARAHADARPLQVLVELDDLSTVALPRDEAPGDEFHFAFQDQAELAAGAGDACEVLARAQYWSPEDDAATRATLAPAVAERAGFWRDWRADFERDRVARLRATLEAETVARWRRWEERFQEALAQAFERLVERAGGPLELSDGRLDRAAERARYTLRDYGSRSVPVVASPDYELVHLLTRRAGDYAGFEVERAHSRVLHGLGDEAESGAQRGVLLPALLGSVRTPRLRDVYAQRADKRRLEALRRMSERSEVEQLELTQLVARVWRRDEQYGSDGIEGYFNEELTGRNGYLEQRGLEQAQDGAPLTLSVDALLQRAALEVFDAPAPDPAGGEVLDTQWLSRPTGALVLMDVDGFVHAMASYPDRERGDGLDLRDRELERTLRLYRFQPPGSVIKPFVAAWALDRLHLDPSSGVSCATGNLPDGRPGYGSVHCSSRYGHDPHVELSQALAQSCNSYFAWLGHTHYRPQDWLDMYAEFGFGQPTGVRMFGERYGLREDGWRGAARVDLSAFTSEGSLMLACNGLALPQTTVLQVARAYAGLATGNLPEVRLVRAIGAVELAPSLRPLAISEAALERVRAALEDCANAPGGSAVRALSQRELGFAMAAKTGSADLAGTDFGSGQRVTKHTWLAGWFPIHAPRYVLVVFCDTTSATASHSTIWLARQFLTHPDVAARLRAEGLLP